MKGYGIMQSFQRNSVRTIDKIILRFFLKVSGMTQASSGGMSPANRLPVARSRSKRSIIFPWRVFAAALAIEYGRTWLPRRFPWGHWRICPQINPEEKCRIRTGNNVAVCPKTLQKLFRLENIYYQIVGFLLYLRRIG